LGEESHEDKQHPRATSIQVRERLTKHVETKVLALAGLIAHGRGEAFDYILGEETTHSAKESIKAAAAALLLAESPILSVNGNVAALCASELVELSNITGAKLEVNLYHRLPGRLKAIETVLKQAGAKEILGINEIKFERINEIYSNRRIVDREGIFIADVVFVPLEDGDRTEGLLKMGKKVITVDLNPMSRTAQFADVTIVDNVVRAMPLLVKEAIKLQKMTKKEKEIIIDDYNNTLALSEAMKTMMDRLEALSKKGTFIELGEHR
jgi:4-phosphopantoate--beta-alanine ligase